MIAQAPNWHEKIAFKRGVSCKDVGQTHDGHAITTVSLTNAKGVRAVILPFGATLKSLYAPDRNGDLADVVLGHDDCENYWRTPSYQGVCVGRYANRIREGRFRLDGVSHKLTCNDKGHHLHGGLEGFDRRLWSVVDIGRQGSASVTLSLVSPDGDQGYPGEVTVMASYALGDDDTLTLDFQATTTRTTVINLTNHAFFNLGGASQGQRAVEHELTVFADAFTPVDEDLIPTGDVLPVQGTPFDFRQARRVADRLDDPADQIRLGHGYDHNFVLRGPRGTLRPAARLDDPASGRRLEISTTEAGLQVYSGNFLDGTVIGKRGRPMDKGDGICLEPQTFPDAPNQPGFPSARLDPGQTYRHTITYRLSVFG